MKAITLLLAVVVSSFPVADLSAHTINRLSSSVIITSPKLVAGEVFGSINGHRQQNGVSLSWTIITLDAIDGFIIERSYDGINFSTIGELNTVSVGWNRFKDEFVFPGYVHYRVKAMMADGSMVTSPTEIVRIVSKK
jgi:hypothetical protein